MRQPTKRTVLALLTRQRLYELGKHLKLDVKRAMKHADLVDVVAAARAVSFKQTLAELSHDELKKICRTHDLDDGSRAKRGLIVRILGGDDHEDGAQAAAEAAAAKSVGKQYITKRRTAPKKHATTEAGDQEAHDQKKPATKQEPATKQKQRSNTSSAQQKLAEGATPELRVFYSWQSDSPRRCNQDFIRHALHAAVAQVSDKNMGTVRIALDEATREEPGSPNIPQVLFRKISQADIFIADVSTISTKGQPRPVQNPNVLIELGFASGLLGWGRIVLIANAAQGNFPDDLPFDIDRHRALSYSLDIADSHNHGKIASKRGSLTADLREAIKTIVECSPPLPVAPVVDSKTVGRQRDIRTLHNLLLCLNPDVLDDHVRNAPKRIDPSVIQFWEHFNGAWTALGTALYDEDMANAIDALHKKWNATLAFGAFYDYPPSLDASIWTRAHDDSDGPAWQEATNAVRELQAASMRVFELLRARFIELDLEERRQASWRWYYDQEAAMARRLGHA